MREEKKKDHPVLLDSIKVVGMKKYFIFQKQKKRGNKKMLCEIDSLTSMVAQWVDLRPLLGGCARETVYEGGVKKR